MNLKILAASGLIAAAALSGTASGTAIYTIDTGNAAVTGTGPYATVSITAAADGLSATVEFDSLTNGGFTYLMGDGGTADLNVNGSYTLGTVTESNSVSGFSTPTFVSNTPGQVDGFGTFSLSLNSFDGFTNSADLISFTLTNTSAVLWTDTTVLTPNKNGAIAAIHVFACANSPDPCNTTEGATFTGFAATSGNPVIPPQEIPEPGVLSLLGLGLLGLSFGAIRRRRV